MTFSLFLDVVVAVLLVATIIYAAMLNRRLAGLRSNKAELEELIRSFGEACARAEAGVRTLRTATEEATRLQQYLDRSQSLRDDLAYLLDRGSSLADRLEGGVRTARTEAKPRNDLIPERAPAPAPMARADRPLAADRAERSDRPDRGLSARLSERAEERAAAVPERSRPERLGERLAERMSERAAPAAAEAAVPAEPRSLPARPEISPRRERPGRLGGSLASSMGAAGADGAPPADARGALSELAPRSKAERELLQALRARR